MRSLIALTYLFVATLLFSCDRQQADPNIDPMLGRECFETRRASLPPGTQYEGVDELAAERLTIKIMNGVEVTTVDCAMNTDGTLRK